MASAGASAGAGGASAGAGAGAGSGITAHAEVKGCGKVSPFMISTPSPVRLTEEELDAAAEAAALKPGEATITEGSTTVVFGTKNECFYNKVQVLNRDLSTLAIMEFDRMRIRDMKPRDLRRAYFKSQQEAGVAEKDIIFPEHLEPPKITVLEALSATGLRSVRYAKEIPNLGHVLTNDLDEAAVDSIRRNAAFNRIDPSVLVPNQGDATMVLHATRAMEPYDVVDLDPYGTAAPFLDAAVQSVKPGGMMLVTCTDLSAICGNHMEMCFPKYGSVPLKSSACHELALRTLLYTIESAAIRHKRHIKPLLSLQVDFYIRVFVRVYETSAELPSASSRMSHMFQCVDCRSTYLQPLATMVPHRSGKSMKSVPTRGPVVPQACEECGGKFAMGGPIWNAPIHDREFVTNLVSALESPDQGGLSQQPTSLPEHDAGSNTKATVKHSRDRLLGLLKSCADELPDVPLFYTIDMFCTNLRVASIPFKKVYAALNNAGYRTSVSHVKSGAIKTDAPVSFIWDVLRTHAKENPVHQRHRSDPKQLPYRLLQRPITHEIDFEDRGGVPKKRPKSRYLSNPEPNWGPKNRASGKRSAADAGVEDAPTATADSGPAAAADKETETPSAAGDAAGAGGPAVADSARDSLPVEPQASKRPRSE